MVRYLRKFDKVIKIQLFIPTLYKKKPLQYNFYFGFVKQDMSI